MSRIYIGTSMRSVCWYSGELRFEKIEILSLKKNIKKIKKNKKKIKKPP